MTGVRQRSARVCQYMGLIVWIVIGFLLGALVVRTMPAEKRNRAAALSTGISAAVLGGFLGHGVWDQGIISMTGSSTIYSAIVSLVLLEAYRVSALEQPPTVVEAPAKTPQPAQRTVPPLAEPSAWPPPNQPAAPKPKGKKRGDHAA